MNIFGVMIQLKNSGRTMLAVRGLLVACGGMAAAEEEPPGDWYPQSDFAGQYRAQFVNEALGTYNHHMVVSFEPSTARQASFSTQGEKEACHVEAPSEAGYSPARRYRVSNSARVSLSFISYNTRSQLIDQIP